LLVQNALNVVWFCGVTVSGDMRAAAKQQHNSNAQSNFVDTLRNLPRETKEE
jgi:hypothetical protein